MYLQYRNNGKMVYREIIKSSFEECIQLIHVHCGQRAYVWGFLNVKVGGIESYKGAWLIATWDIFFTSEL
jgi:hypothetical protein